MDSESLVTENLMLVGRALADLSYGIKTPAPKRRTQRGAPTKKTLGATIKICCLGYFSIRRAGEVPINIRMNTRPGALLLLLIAAGPSGIDKRQAEDLLWPQGEGTRTRGMLDSTMYRLRKLLEADSACRAELGMIMLDGNVVSIDAWLFETEADALLTRLRRAGDLDAGEISIRCERLLERYRGPFLATQTSTPWIVRTRNHLQAKFVRVIEEVGKFWQQAGRWDRAIRLFEQGLESDNLSEETYRQIIRCHLAQGHFAEAIRAYHRCRELLAMVLGVAPSAETLALYQHALRENVGDAAL